MVGERVEWKVEKKAAELTAAVLVWRTVVLLAAWRAALMVVYMVD